MELGLKNRTDVVTGSKRGIGKAVAASLLEEGATVLICAVNGIIRERVKLTCRRWVGWKRELGLQFPPLPFPFVEPDDCAAP